MECLPVCGLLEIINRMYHLQWGSKRTLRFRGRAGSEKRTLEKFQREKQTKIWDRKLREVRFQVRSGSFDSESKMTENDPRNVLNEPNQNRIGGIINERERTPIRWFVHTFTSQYPANFS